MPVKTYKPTSPARRYLETIDFSRLSSDRPLKRLAKRLSSTAGRNNAGRITSRHRGGGHKRLYRTIDFRRDKTSIPARVEAIEYDPNRTVHIARVVYRDGERRYILAPNSLKVGQTVMSGEGAEIADGNCLALNAIPLGTFVHNIELRRGEGGKLARSAGSYAQLMAREGRYAQLRLPSGEFRLVFVDNMATIGQLGNLDNMNISIGKAGRSRWLGKRPQTRGAAMNPVDHPHGGGEGRSKGGRHPCSPTAILTKGFKTRHNKATDRFIVRRRKKKKES